MISILYVDDEQDLLEVAQLFLEESGEFRVDTSTSAQQALASPSIAKYDAIISDYLMPEMNGISFLKAIREKLGDIPFILFTGRGREEVVIEAINNGADFYLQKGGDPEAQFAELAHKIRQAVSRRNAEHLRTESEKRIIDIINFLPDATFAIDKSGQVISWNRAMEEMTGVAAKDMLGKGNYEYAVPFYGTRRPILIDLIFEPDNIIRESYSNIIHDKDILIADTTLPKPLGRVVTLLGKASPLYNPQGEITGAIESIRDTTEIKKTEGELRESQRVLSTLMGNLPGMAYRCRNDRQWTMEFVSEGATNLTGYPPSDLIENRTIAFANCIHPDDRDRVWAEIQQALERRQKFTIQYRIITRSDEEKWVWEQGLGIFSHGGQLIAIEGFITDITERRRLVADLEREHSDLQASCDELTAARQELRRQFNQLAESEGTLRINEERLRLAQMIGHTGSWEYDLKTRDIWGSAEGLRIFGFPPVAGTVQIDEIEACIPERERVHQVLVDLIDKGTEYNIEYSIHPRDGSELKTIHSVARLERDAEGNPVRVRGVIHDITSRKRAEEELTFKNVLLSTQQETTLDAILIVNEDGKILNYNRNFVRLWGIPDELLISLQDEPVLQYVMGQLADPDAFLSRVRYLYEHKEEKSFEEILLKDGRVLERFSAPMLADSGKYFGRIWYFRDVSERKKVEDRFRKSKDRFHRLFINMSEGVALHELICSSDNTPEDYRIIDANPAFERHLGISRKSVIGKTSREAYGVTEPPYLDIYAQVARTGEPKVFETYFPPMGKYFLISAYCPAKGTFATIFKDITERKQTMSALRESEAKFRELAELLPQMIFELDMDLRITYANQRAQTVLGFTEAEIGHGINALAFIVPSQHATVREIVQRQLTGIPFEPQEYTALNRNGRTFPVIIYSAPIIREGTPVGFRGVIVDITARKKLEEDLLKRNEELHAAFEQLTATEEELRQNYEELQKSERTLRENEEKFRLLAENSLDGILITNATGTILFANRAAGRIVDVPDPAPLIGTTTVLAFVAPEFHDRILEDYSKIVQGIETPLVHYKILTAAKREIWIECIGGMIKYGSADAILVSMRDVTERKRADEESWNSRQILEGILNSIQVRVFWKDTSLVFLGCNTAFARDAGFEGPADLIGKDDYRMVWRDQADLYRSDDRTVIESGIPKMYIEEPQKTPAGEIITLLTSKVPLKDAQGKIIGVLGTYIDITDRKQAELALNKSQQMLAEAMELANLVSWEHDLLTNTFTFNDRFYALYGTTAEQEGGYRMPAETYTREFVHPDDQQVVLEETEKVLASTDPNYVSQREHRIIRRDGEVRHIIVRIRVVKDATGCTIGTHGANQDITDRKLAEDALRASEARYRLLSDNVHDVIWTADMEMHLTYISPSVRGLRGMTPEDVLAEPPDAALTPASYAEISRSRQKSLEFIRQQPGEVPPCETLELEFYRKDGSTVWTETVIAPAFDSRRKPLGVVGVMRDITIKKEAERALRESEEKYRALVETSPNMVWELDLQGNFRFISSRVKDIMGYLPEELTGRSIIDFVEEQRKPFVRETMARYITTNDPLPPFEIPTRHRDGKALILEIHPSRALAGDGTLVGFRGVAQDITERKAAEEALRQANRQLTLLGTITRHDLLNKITVILGNLKIAEKRCTDAELVAYLEKIRNATTAIKSQIEFTRIYQKLGTLEPQWIHLDTLIPRTHVPETVALDVSVKGVQLRADPMLERVFFNLLDNSLRHGKHVSRICVSSHPAGRNLMVIWEDNGVGIPAEEKEKIFERGYGENTGLGLFLVREILALTGITITETGEPGAGARFEIVVPEGAYRLTTDLRPAE